MRTRLWARMLALLAVVLSVASGAWASGGPTYVLQGSFAGAGEAFFGYSVATDGNTALVGAWNDNSTKGAAYVYLLTGSTWTLQQELEAPDGAANDNLGYAVAVSGNAAMIGSPGRGNNQGYVYVFTRTGSTWSLGSEFTSSDGAANDCFGCAIALSASTAVIGAPGRLGGTGGAYVFSGSGSVWAQQDEFVGAPGEAFGTSVALSGSTALVGANEFSTERGHAYVFTSGGGAWTQQALLAAPGGGDANDNFGISVAVSGNTALIGAYGANAYQGEAYVFTSSGGSWSESAVLTASNNGTPDGKPGDFFGISVALSGGTALVGADEKNSTAGSVYVFANTGATWSPVQEILAPSAGESFGWSVALSSSAAVVGAFSASNDAGAATMLAPVVSAATPALGPAGNLALLVLLAGSAAWSMRRRARFGNNALGAIAGAATAVFLCASTTGCSSSHDQGTVVSNATPSKPRADTGALSLDLTLPGGAQVVNVVSWAVSGPNGAATVVQSSSVEVQALSVQFLVSNIPAGSGYTATLSGTSTDGAVTCTGAADFNISAHATTRVVVEMACGLVSTVGHGTTISGTTYDCAALSSVAASPVEVVVGSSVALTANANGPNPAGLTYAWSSSSFGVFDEPNESVTNFTCTQVGSAMVTIRVADGPVPTGSMCNQALDSATITVVCEPPPCIGVGTGIVATPDSVAGTCPAGQVNTLTDSAGNFCCAIPFCSGQPLGTTCDAGLICNGGAGCVAPSFSVVRVKEYDGGGVDPSSAVVVEQHLLDGGLTGTPVSLPTAASGGTEPFTIGGTAVTEGDLNTSANGLYLTMAGYQASPGVVSVDTTLATTVTRSVARIDATGHVVITPIPGAFSGGDPRSAVTVDGSEYWVSGDSATSDTTHSGGVWYLPNDTQIAQMPTPTLLANPRLLRIAAGQLYGDSAQNPPYIFALGNGLPTTASTLTTLPGFLTASSTPSPYSFAFFDLNLSVPGVDTLYVADDTAGVGGLQKWTLGAGGTWSTVWSILTGGTAIRGLAGYVSGSTVTLMVSSASKLGNPDALAVILDPIGSTNTAMTPVTVVATASAGSTFRGVAVPPHL